MGPAGRTPPVVDRLCSTLAAARPDVSAASGRPGGGANPRSGTAANRLVRAALAISSVEPSGADRRRPGPSREADMLHRWVGRPPSSSAYLVAGLFTGVVTFTVTVTVLALSLGLLPVFLLGIPVFVATVFVVHGLAAMDRARAATLFGRRPRRPPGPPRARRRLGPAHLRSRSQSPEVWKEAAYAVLLLPVAVVSGTLVLSFWSVAVAGRLPSRSTSTSCPATTASAGCTGRSALEACGRVRRRAGAAAAGPRADGRPHRRADRAGSRPAARRATATRCAPRSPSCARPEPGSSTPPTPSAAGSSATCTTARSSSSSRSP